jgi:hypothetical protein
MPLSSRTRHCRCLLPTPSSLTSTASPRPSLYWALRPATVARDETYLHTESDDMSKLVWQGRIVIMVAQKRCRHPELSPHLSRHAISPDERLQSMTTFLPYHLAYLLLIQICPDQFVFLDSQITITSTISTSIDHNGTPVGSPTRNLVSLPQMSTRNKKEACCTSIRATRGNKLLTPNRTLGRTFFAMLSTLLLTHISLPKAD